MEGSCLATLSRLTPGTRYPRVSGLGFGVPGLGY